jgi:hypothetical protein
MNNTDHCSWCGVAGGKLYQVAGLGMNLHAECIEGLREERQENFGDIRIDDETVYLIQENVRWQTCVECGVRVEGRDRELCSRCKSARNRARPGSRAQAR